MIKKCTFKMHIPFTPHWTNQFQVLSFHFVVISMNTTNKKFKKHQKSYDMSVNTKHIFEEA